MNLGIGRQLEALRLVGLEAEGPLEAGDGALAHAGGLGKRSRDLVVRPSLGGGQYEPAAKPMPEHSSAAWPSARAFPAPPSSHLTMGFAMEHCLAY